MKQVPFDSRQTGCKRHLSSAGSMQKSNQDGLHKFCEHNYLHLQGDQPGEATVPAA